MLRVECAKCDRLLRRVHELEDDNRALKKSNDLLFMGQPRTPPPEHYQARVAKLAAQLERSQQEVEALREIAKGLRLVIYSGRLPSDHPSAHGDQRKIAKALSHKWADSR